MDSHGGRGHGRAGRVRGAAAEIALVPAAQARDGQDRGELVDPPRLRDSRGQSFRGPAPSPALPRPLEGDGRGALEHVAGEEEAVALLEAGGHGKGHDLGRDCGPTEGRGRLGC